MEAGVSYWRRLQIGLQLHSGISVHSAPDFGKPGRPSRVAAMPTLSLKHRTTRLPGAKVQASKSSIGDSKHQHSDVGHGKLLDNLGDVGKSSRTILKLVTKKK